MPVSIVFECEECPNSISVRPDIDYKLVMQHLPDGWRCNRHTPPNDDRYYITCPDCFKRNRELARGGH